jgi:serine phosphatase RsbU (regulator of sigma subunit)
VLLAVPLSSQNGILGAMVLEETESSPGSPERRREIISGIAQQAALAVQSERYQQERVGRERLERELQLARDIQQTFIPRRLPQPAGWQLAATWRAAREVAGDFYDLFELPGGALGILIADVADKGMPAALFMTLTRTLMRAATIENHSPSTALCQVNDLLVPDAHAGMFVTAFYAVLSPDTGKLCYANAGHNRPLLRRASTGETVPLEKGEMALGVLPGTRLVEHSLELAPGDCLVLYTDGVTEAFSVDSRMFGQEGLGASIQSARGGSAQATLDAIDQSVREFVGSGALSDDLTILVVRRTQAD